MQLPNKYIVLIDNDHPRMDEVYHHFSDLQKEYESETIWNKNELKTYKILIFNKDLIDDYGGVDADEILYGYEDHTVFSVDEFLSILNSKEQEYDIF